MTPDAAGLPGGWTVRAAHRAWRAATAPSSARFGAALRHCESAQRNVLQALLRANRDTAYGRRHGFGAIRSAEQFAREVPLTRHEDYEDALNRIAGGGTGVLTRGRVLLFEPSSGTTSAAKHIPYTADLRREFQRALSPWIHSLYAQFPGIAEGRHYWSVSPPVRREAVRRGCVPVGFDDDAQYLHPWVRGLFRLVAIAPDIAGADDAREFRVRTAAALLSASDLAFLSVWSPSFLRLICDAYLGEPEAVLRRCPAARARELERIGAGRDAFVRAWPRLALISCWTDAASASEAARLRDLFPGVPLQGKGLLATEAVATVPWARDADPVLAVRSHFFEFIGDDGGIVPAWQVREGAEYALVVTTGGGFYRYRLEDRVLATGAVGSTPTFRFLGKGAHVSDRFGEKLNEAHVARVLEALLPGGRFAMLAPDAGPEGACYTLYVEGAPGGCGGIGAALERGLRENPHYSLCASLGQLARARVFLTRGDAFAAYESRMAAAGMKRGDVKPARLSRLDGWSRVFEGDYL